MNSNIHKYCNKLKNEKISIFEDFTKNHFYKRKRTYNQMIEENSKIFKNYNDLLPKNEINKIFTPSLKYNNNKNCSINEINEILNNLNI